MFIYLQAKHRTFLFILPIAKGSISCMSEVLTVKINLGFTGHAALPLSNFGLVKNLY
jgi:hypothetical protein